MASVASRSLPWAGVLLVALATGFCAVEATRAYLGARQQDTLAVEASRRAVEIMASTLNGNVMGSVAALGLLNPLVRQAARGEVPPVHPGVMEVLGSVGESYKANGVFVVDARGVVRSSWYTIGRSLNGVDVRFRPYFQIAMQGRQNVYAAIGTTTGERALYFAAPLYEHAAAGSAVIGVIAARLDVQRIDSVLEAWPGPALLLSPQRIAFASNRPEWDRRMGGEATPAQLEAIRALKQFGATFESGTPAALPFDIGASSAQIDGRPHALASAPVFWNDPHGQWTLLLLSDLDALVPASTQAAVGAASAAVVLLLGGIFLVWRGRLRRANDQRRRAEEDLKAHAVRLQADASVKEFLAMLSRELQQARSLEDLARRLMFHAVPRLEAEYGAFYVLDQASRRLLPAGGHGVPAGEMESFAPGQGLVGQCAKDGRGIVIDDASRVGIRIVWGAGSIAPRSVAIQPVAHAGRVLGVLVLAWLREPDAGRRALLEALLPTLAMSLDILQRNLATERQSQVLEGQQTRLKETEAWYRGIIEQAPDGMLVIDESGVIILTNPRLDAMFGHAEGALIGQKIEVLVPPGPRAGHVALREGFARGGTTRAMGQGLALRGLRRDGTEFPVEVALSNLPALGSHGRCSCATVRDVTERKRTEEALRKARDRAEQAR